MKKLLQRVFGVVVSAALLVTSGMTAFADAGDSGHSHRADDEPITSSSGGYTITLTTPESYPEIDATNSKKFSYGAYQIFTGTVKDKEYTEGDDVNPGSKGTQIPITDIKWGNAFGIVGKDTDAGEVDQNAYDAKIVGFVIALAEASSGKYSYAFSGFDGFNVVQSEDTKETAFIKKGTDDKTYLADRFVTGEANIDEGSSDFSAVNFDKLAVAVSDVLVAHQDHEWLQAFNDILGGFGQGAEEGAYANPGYVSRYYGGSWAEDYNSYKIEHVPAGYYMILDRTGIADGDTDEAYSARMLFVVNNVTQVLKESIPTLEKNVVRDDDLYETEAAGVGDDVKFRLTGTLPDNYDLYLGGYQYKFTDTLSKGLTLKPLGTGGDTYVTVKVKNVYNADGELVSTLTGEYEISKNSYKTPSVHITEHDSVTEVYTEKYDTEEGKNVLTVTFPCLKEIEIDVDSTKYYIGEKSEIYIDYTAVVNKDAIVSPDNGNENTAVLEYSDNPQSYGDTDNTTEKHAKVYTFGLDIVKVDAADFLKADNKAEKAGLKGAKFVIVRPNPTDATKYQIAKLTKFEKETAPADPPTPRSFTDTYYSIDEWTDLGETPATDAALQTAIDTFLTKDGITKTDYEMETADGGKLLISGLNDGVTYTMVETATPEGDYAKINPFTIELTAATEEKGGKDEYNGKLSKAESDKQIGEGKSFSFDNPVDVTDEFGTTDDGSAKMLVANFKYVDLPSTGGVGTYWFYILGAGGLAISFVLFRLSRKKIVQ